MPKNSDWQCHISDTSTSKDISFKSFGLMYIPTFANDYVTGKYVHENLNKISSLLLNNNIWHVF